MEERTYHFKKTLEKNRALSWAATVSAPGAAQASPCRGVLRALKEEDQCRDRQRHRLLGSQLLPLPLYGL